MSGVTVTVEQVIGHVSQTFSSMVFVRTERVGDGDKCRKYLMACFLRNCMTCIENQISEYFGCSPPTLEEFLEERDPLPASGGDGSVPHAHARRRRGVIDNNGNKHLQYTTLGLLFTPFHFLKKY